MTGSDVFVVVLGTRADLRYRGQEGLQLPPTDS